MGRRVILLNQWYEPEPSLKGQSFARELTSRGYEVEVVTGYPNYPGGRLYPGYRMRWAHREVSAGVTVTRLPLYPSHDSSAVRRIANYGSFAAAAAAYLAFQAKRTDLIYVHQLPTLAAVAGIVKLKWGARLVLDIQDVWPDSLFASGMMPQPLLALAGAFTAWSYRRADQIVVQSPGFRRTLIERGLPEDRITVVYNWCNEDTLLGAPGGSLPPEFPGPETFRIAFAGNMGHMQALSSVLDAAELLRTSAPQIRFVLIGDGVQVDDLKRSAAARGLDNVVFLPRVPMDQVATYLEAADALLVHLQHDPLFEITIPAKTQAYMAVGKPVLMAVAGDAAALVEDARCGVTAIPEDADSIATAARRLAALPRDQLGAMGERGRAYYDANMRLTAAVDRFDTLFGGADAA